MVEWVFIGGDGSERGTSEVFATQADAEAWFGSSWETLATAGTTHVALRAIDGGDEIYRMSLAAE
jgi:hypothetical protein